MKAIFTQSIEDDDTTLILTSHSDRLCMCKKQRRRRRRKKKKDAFPSLCQKMLNVRTHALSKINYE
jgi:hypothetical protein